MFAVFLKYTIQIFSLSLLRYLLFAGGAYGVFYVWEKEKFFAKKIQAKFPENKKIGFEIINSFLSLIIFACVGGVIVWLKSQGYTLIYTNFKDHSGWYFAFTSVLLIFTHDFYFYFSHRFMHWQKIYRYVHRVHHISTNPTPWAAFSFHPLEALVEVGLLPILVFVVPLHPYSILIWLLFMTLYNVVGHLGYEFFKSGFSTHPISKWHNSSTHHNMHHKYLHCNYSLYFNFWDRIFGTNHPNYENQFEENSTKSV